MDAVTLPPELERFATEAVAAGRYHDVAEIVRTGVELVRQRELARADFIASLEAAEADAEKNGTFSLDEVLAEMDRIIEAADRRDG